MSQLTRLAARHGRSAARRESVAEMPPEAVQAFADSLPLMLWMSDEDGNTTYVNRSWLSFTGRRLEDELGRGWMQGMHEDDLRACMERSKGQPQTDEFALEFRLKRADGEFRWLLGHGAPRFDNAGRFLGHIGSAVDITDRREELIALADSEQTFRRLIENAEDMVYRIRLKPTVACEYMGGAVQAITGRSSQDFYTDRTLPRAAMHPEDVHHIVDSIEEVDQLSRVATIRWVHRDGRIVWAEHRRVPVLDRNNRLIAIEGIARDVTERVQTQQQLRRSREQMRDLAARVESAREHERTTLARELHDEVGQSLTAIKMELVRANAVFQKNRLQLSTIDRLQSLIGLTEIAISTVKRISTNLRPPALDHLGLAEGIRWESVAFRGLTGLRCRVKADAEGIHLSANQQTVVFRIFQEALTNVVRHARASAVNVSLVERHGVFEMRVRDNGIGISAEQVADPKSIGLLGMRERAELIGGTFDVTGRLGKGTVVIVRLPLPNAPPSTPGKKPASRRHP